MIQLLIVWIVASFESHQDSKTTKMTMKMRITTAKKMKTKRMKKKKKKKENKETDCVK